MTDIDGTISPITPTLDAADMTPAVVLQIADLVVESVTGVEQVLAQMAEIVA